MKKKIMRFLRKLIKTVLKDIRYTIGHPQAVQLGLVTIMAAVFIGPLLFNVMVYAFHAETILATFVVVHLFLGFLGVFGNVLALKYHTNAVGLLLINAIIWLLTKGITSAPCLIPSGAIDVQMACGIGFALKCYQVTTKPATAIANNATTAYTVHHNITNLCKSLFAKARYNKLAKKDIQLDIYRVCDIITPVIVGLRAVAKEAALAAPALRYVLFGRRLCFTA